MIYKETKYDFIVIGSDGEVYTTYYPGYIKKKCAIRNKVKTFRIKVNKHKTTVRVAKLVGELYVPNPENLKFVLTKDGDEMNTHPDNLYWSESNRMDYAAFSKKKMGMHYKDLLGNIAGDYTVTQDKGKELELTCNNCKDIVNVTRYSNKKICSRCIDIPSLESETFKNWKILKQESFEIDSKTLLIECTCCGQQDTVNYKRFKKRKSEYKCNILKEKRRRLFNKLSNMKVRCNDPSNKSYKSYGAKGIKVCKEWEEDSESFIKWSLDNGYDIGLEIDRINNNKGYSENNCQYLSNKDHREKHK